MRTKEASRWNEVVSCGRVGCSRRQLLTKTEYYHVDADNDILTVRAGSTAALLLW